MIFFVKSVLAPGSWVKPKKRYYLAYCDNRVTVELTFAIRGSGIIAASKKEGAHSSCSYRQSVWVG